MRRNFVVSKRYSVQLFFTEPRYSLQASPDYPITFLIMLLTSVISSTLATRVKTGKAGFAESVLYRDINEQQQKASAGA